MDKKEYKQKLKDLRWKEKRNYIVARDYYQCTRCNNKKYLQVHHLYYKSDKEPWDYPDDAFITLCKTCHEKEHNISQKRKTIKGQTNRKQLNLNDSIILLTEPDYQLVRYIINKQIEIFNIHTTKFRFCYKKNNLSYLIKNQILFETEYQGVYKVSSNILACP